MSDAILKIIDDNKELLNKQYIKPMKQPNINIYNSLDKSDEITKIYNIKIDTNYRILKLELLFKQELNGFTYLNDINELTNIKDKIFIRYVGVNTKFNFGGLLRKCNKNSLTLLNLNNKSHWTVSINDNFIWYTKIKSNDDKKRESFELMLKQFEQK